MPPPALIQPISAGSDRPPVLNSRPPALRWNTGTRDCASGIRMSIGTADAIVQSGATRMPPGAWPHAASVKRWRWSFGVGPYSRRRSLRIDRTVRERNLIVVRVVERLGQRVADARNPNAAPRCSALTQQRVVLRVHARLEVDDAVGSADNRVEHLADRSGR